MKRRKIKKLLPLFVAAGLVILSALCYLGYEKTAVLLQSQQAAERWRGENETAFAQISCFASASEPMSEEQIYTLRSDMLKKLSEASFEVSPDTTLIRDTWSGTGKVTVSNGQRKGDVSVSYVSGDYFLFHPLKLISGNYLSPDDLMQDRVLIDRETAWLLFGGEELSGMGFEINGEPFVVAGVFQREDDRFSRRAYDGGMGIYMHHEAYKRLSENAPISCYELVMAEPVQGFVLSAVEEKLPKFAGEIVDNTYRFDFWRLIGLMKEGRTRSMHLSAAVYPYWENAARAAEDAALRWLCAAMLLALLPAVLLVWFVIRAIIFGKARLEDEYIPETKERLEEAIRIRQRKRWENRQNKHRGS